MSIPPVLLLIHIINIYINSVYMIPPEQIPDPYILIPGVWLYFIRLFRISQINDEPPESLMSFQGAPPYEFPAVILRKGEYIQSHLTECEHSS